MSNPSTDTRSPARERAEQLYRLLGETHFRYKSERELQDQMDRVFKAAELVYTKEYILTKQDRPDFFFEEECLAVEVKIAGTLSNILRQLKRYADHPKVQAVLLVSQRSHALPATLSGKPVYLCSIWRSGIM